MTKPIKRLKKKILKENLWIFVLSLLKKKERYRFEIKNIIKKEFGFICGNVTAYKVLYFLEIDNYVKSFQKKKKYYKITYKGKNELKNAETFLKKIIKMIK